MSLTAPTITGYSAFWQITGDKSAYSMSQSQVRAKDAKAISKFMRNAGTRDAIGAIAALIGAAAGGAALNQWTQVAPPLGPQQTVPTATGIGDFGGNRTITTVNAINRVTTAADVTELKKWFTAALLEAGITYPSRLGSSVAGGTMHANMPGFS
jgi:hypothetical protein